MLSCYGALIEFADPSYKIEESEKPEETRSGARSSSVLSPAELLAAISQPTLKEAHRSNYYLIGQPDFIKPGHIFTSHIT